MTISIEVPDNIISDNGSLVSNATTNQFIGNNTSFTYPASSSMAQAWPATNGPGSLTNDGAGNYSFVLDLPLAGGTLSGALTLNADPTTNLQAATKQYVDAFANGVTFKDAVIVATTANLTATYSNGTAGVGATLTNSGTQATFALDGVTPSVGSRVLIKNQTTTFQNGSYTVTNAGSGSTNWILTRTTDYDTSAEVMLGTAFWVAQGTTQGNTQWVENGTGPFVIGTTPITFVQFAANTGTVNTVSVVTANGVSGTVANATTTPAITVALGAITPSSVAASGAVSGSNLSGTNTGDQTITLTGDVTGSGTGSFATTLETVNTDVGSFSNANITVDGKGRILAASNGGGGGSTLLYLLTGTMPTVQTTSPSLLASYTLPANTLVSTSGGQYIIIDAVANWNTPPVHTADIYFYVNGQNVADSTLVTQTSIGGVVYMQAKIINYGASQSAGAIITTVRLGKSPPIGNSVAPVNEVTGEGLYGLYPFDPTMTNTLEIWGSIDNATFSCNLTSFSVFLVS